VTFNRRKNVGPLEVGTGVDNEEKGKGTKTGEGGGELI